MKKIFAAIVCALLIFTMVACNESKTPNSSENSGYMGEEYKVSLIRALTGTDDVSAIKSLSIVRNDTSVTEITEKEDWEFFEKYTYFDRISFAEKEKLISNKLALIKCGFSEGTIYLLNDGRIIKQEMCGDSGVPQEEGDFEIYKAEEKYTLNEQKLIELLEKYNKKEINVEISSNEIDSSSMGPTICPPVPNDFTTENTQQETVAPKGILPEVQYNSLDSDVKYTDMVALSNGGYAVVGVKETYDYPLSLIRIYDNVSQLKKECLFGEGNGYEKFAACFDGGFIAASYNPPCLTKISKDFRVEWVKAYENVELEGIVEDVEEIDIGCYAVLYSRTPYDKKTLKMAFLDSRGNVTDTVELMKSVDISDGDITPDGRGGFYLILTCNKELSNKFDLLKSEYDSSKRNEVAIMHFDRDRKLTWVKTIGGGGDDWVEEATMDENGNFYIAVGTNWYGADAFWEMGVERTMPYRRMLVKLDKNGNLVYKVPLSNLTERFSGVI